MIIFNPHHYSIMPGALICQPACILSFPTSVEVEDSWLNRGAGIGSGSSSIKSALGEYFERRHFYMEIKSDLVGKLDFSLSDRESKSMAFAFSQTNNRDYTSAQILEHSFNLTRAYRVSDFSDCYIPTACVSLNYYKIESENSIYPLRDTCGCSFHSSFETAFLGSLKECLERQFLARFWLTKSCNKLEDYEVETALSGSSAKALYNALVKSGELTVLDISDCDYPGSCLLTVYGQADESRNVHYCAGMAYAGSLASALEKSIYELWQTYRFLDLFAATEGDVEEVEDSYLRYFIGCNKYETFREITSINISGRAPRKPTFDFSLDGLLTVLSAQEIDGYLYTETISMENSQYHFCKFFSPDFFFI